MLSVKRLIIYSGESKGGPLPPPLPPRTKIFLISCGFLGKSGKFVCWRPLLRGILDAPLIYHGDYHIYCILGIFSIALPFRYTKKLYI